MPKECDFIKSISENLFRAVGIFFSAMLLLFSLLNSVSLAALGDRISEIKEEKDRLIKENRYLRAEHEFMYSLQNIERVGREELQLQPASAQQIIYIDLPGEG